MLQTRTKKMERILQLSIICWLTVIVSTIKIGDKQNITLSKDGGYADILIAISERVPENRYIITNLKKYFTEASTALLGATRNRMYFKNVTIVVPSNWSNDPSWQEPEMDETYDRARILVAEANPAYGNIPYTLQTNKECGEEGEYIHFTPEYLVESNSDHLPFKPAKRIVKVFSKLKWGLFDEDIPASDTETPRYYRGGMIVKAFSCKADAPARPKNLTACGNEGRDPLTCDVIYTFIDGNTSLLSADYLDEVTEFCTAETHNRDAINRQNTNCGNRSAWEVMDSLPDFKNSKEYAENRALDWIPEPIFRIVQHGYQIDATNITTSTTTTSTTLSTTTLLTSTLADLNIKRECAQDVVCLCLDTSGSMNTDNRIGIMSDSVEIYITTYLRDNAAVGIVGFSSSPYLYADMTEITSDDVRSYLSSEVPTRAGGGTDIGRGILECHRILQIYAGENIDSTRIVLLSDGAGNIGNSIEIITGDGITLDTILYGQGGYLADQAERTGGKQIYASDEYGQADLAQFFAESASRGCSAENSDVVVLNEIITIPAGESAYRGVVPFDVTIGLDTKLVFKYSHEVDVSISDEQNLNVSFSRNVELGTIIAAVDGEVTGSLEVIITKSSADLHLDVTIVITVTSSPVPGIIPIDISNNVNDEKIKFGPNTEIIGYVGVFQGLTPVLDLTVVFILEQPGSSSLEIPCNDKGTGKDAIPNDGVYTGFVPAHKIGGSSAGSYYGLTVKISGDGQLPGLDSNSKRRKRCIDCRSLGNVTRSNSGGVVVINNWYQVEDTTPPERITDLRVVNATEDNVFTLRWTAPGDDLNIGTVSGYEFIVGSKVSIEDYVDLLEEAILSNVFDLLVNSGNELEMTINASVIPPAMLNLNDSVTITTYYFRMRTYDANNNFAAWSNPAFASYVDPAVIAAIIFGTPPAPETTTTETPEQRPPNRPGIMILVVVPCVIGITTVAVVIGTVIVRCRKCRQRERNARYSVQQEGNDKAIYMSSA